jgi:hypothetical protein
MFKSLEILQNLPGNEEREETCENFKNLLLDTVRPRVRKVIKENELSQLQEYVYVFEKLGRLDLVLLTFLLNSILLIIICYYYYYYYYY